MPDRHIDENEVLRDALSGLTDEVPPMPEGLHAAWMQQVEEDAMQKKEQPTRTRFLNQTTRFLSIAAALIFVVGGTLLTRDDLRDSMTIGGMNGKARIAGQYAEDTEAGYGSLSDANSQLQIAAATEDDYRIALDAYTASETSAPMMARSRSMPEEPAVEESTPEKKIIRTASMTIAAVDWKECLAALRAGCEQTGGWVESTSESTNASTGLRTASLTLRIPQDALDDFLSNASNLGRVTRRHESATDVTESYQDTAARLATQQALMARLQALIVESADLSDLLALESQIADTQYEIDRLQALLNSTDRQVAYATVNITLKEETTPDLTDGAISLGDRLGAAIRLGWESFTAFLADAAVFLVAALPFLGIVIVVTIAGRIVLRMKRRNQ